MRVFALALHVLLLLALPLLMSGVIQRTKALWAGRKGPPLLQLLFELRRLLSKRPVYGDTTSVVFRLGPLVVLATTLVTALFIPLLGPRAPLGFEFDFVVVAYLWGLGRLFLILPALDTGSAFEGMGASREATYAALAEPVLLLVFGTLGLASGQRSLLDLLHARLATTPAGLMVSTACVAALLVVLQVESARIPVDDPSTHLELTMIHEVMILDHSGPELAFLQYAAALKLTLGAALIAALLNPVHTAAALASALQLLCTLCVAVVVGCVESLTARLALRALPQYILLGLIAAFIALLGAAWRSGLA
jgi:formate hydrogenlyase subunit 4